MRAYQHPVVSPFAWLAAALAPFVALVAACGGSGGGGGAPGGSTALALLGYSEPSATYEALQPIAPNVPSLQGVATSWTIAPPLPSGLVLDPATGVVSGAASDPAPLATYTVTASNATESEQVALEIEVVPPGTTMLVLVSQTPDSVPGDGSSTLPACSDDGRRVVFVSASTNFSSIDVNETLDGYLRDATDESVSIVSATPKGEVGAGHVESIDTDANGLVVVFHSDADDLAGGSPNSPNDVYVHDVATGSLERISIGATPTATGPSDSVRIDGAGELVVYRSGAHDLVEGDTNGDSDIFLHHIPTGTTQRVSLTDTGAEANDASLRPEISHDGEAVAFVSSASNLVGGDTNGRMDVFVRQLATGAVQRVSVGDSGQQASDHSGADRPALSADGRYVAFVSAAENLVQGDDNEHRDVFVFDRFTDEIERVSVASDGTQNGSDARSPDISGDGRHVVFLSNDDDLAPDDTQFLVDVFRHDRETGATACVSRGPGGEPCNNDCDAAAISTDGSVVLFSATYAGLFPGLDFEFQVWARVPLDYATASAPQRGGIAFESAFDVFQVVPASRMAPFTVRRALLRGDDGPSGASVWRARADAPWLRLEPSSGTLERGEGAQLDLHFETAGLPVGRYQTAVVLEDAGGVELARCDVLLRVIP